VEKRLLASVLDINSSGSVVQGTEYALAPNISSAEETTLYETRWAFIIMHLSRCGAYLNTSTHSDMRFYSDGSSGRKSGA
jgi:hypothetical protein